MEIDDNSWLMGFFEGQTSFAVNIGLTKTKNKRYVILKPIINIANADEHQLNFIIKHLGLSSKISKKKKKEEHHNVCYSLNIQRFGDIDEVLKILAEYKFKSDIKQNKVTRFVDCYLVAKRLGMIHTKWDDGLNEFIDKKLKINVVRSNIEKNRFSKDDWVKKIQEHLNS